MFFCSFHQPLYIGELELDWFCIVPDISLVSPQLKKSPKARYFLIDNTVIIKNTKTIHFVKMLAK
jgi:hypothetical protein